MDLEDTWDDLTGQDRKTKVRTARPAAKQKTTPTEWSIKKESVAENLRLRFFLFWKWETEKTYIKKG